MRTFIFRINPCRYCDYFDPSTKERVARVYPGGRIELNGESGYSTAYSGL